MSAHLQSAPAFTFHAEVTYDSVITGGQMIQYGGRVDVSVRRPDGLRCEYRGDMRNSSLVFDGRTTTILDLNADVYSIMEATGDIDDAVDHLFDVYGFSVPIADFVYADPYAALTGFVDSGFVVGPSVVDGVRCHHVAFAQQSIDWQIWIEDGPRPLPRKLVITYKDEPGAPQYTARLSKWNLDSELSDHFFEFHAPAGADEIEFMPVAGDLPNASIKSIP